MNRQKKKVEKFIDMFCKGMDDELMEIVLRTAYLGEDESRFDEFMERQQKENEEYASHFEITDVSQTIITEEEQQQIKSNHIVEQNGTSDPSTSSDKGHNHISPEHATDDRVSIERGLQK